MNSILSKGILLQLRVFREGLLFIKGVVAKKG